MARRRSFVEIQGYKRSSQNDRELPGAAPTCVAECPTTREKFDRLSSRAGRRTCFSLLRTDY